MPKDFEILQVKMNDMVFSVGEIIIHNDGDYATQIVKFCLSETSPPLIWFYFNEDLEFVKDLNNFRKITSMSDTLIAHGHRKNIAVTKS